MGHDRASGGFDPGAVNPAEFQRLTGLSRSRAGTLRKKGFSCVHGRTGSRAETTVLTGFEDELDGLIRSGATQLLGVLRQDTGQGLPRRPRQGEGVHSGQVAPGPAGQEDGAVEGDRHALHHRARRGVPDGPGLRRRPRPGGERAAHGVLRDGLPPLRHVLRGVLPQRPPGEPVHRHGEGLRRPGGSAQGADRQHEERRRPPRRRRQAGAAGRLRGVHAVRGVRDAAARALPPLHQGQGREARPVREGQLRRREDLLRHHRPQRPGARVVRAAVQPVAQGCPGRFPPTSTRPRACRRRARSR